MLLTQASTVEPQASTRGGRRPIPPKGGRNRRRLWSVLSIVVVAAVFGFLMPQLASYQGVWADLRAMPWPRTILVACAGAANLTAYWIMIVTILPSLRLRQAALLNLGPTAAANTLPAGEAVALGISWAMLSSWGISTKQYMLYTLLSGTLNTCTKLILPIVALAILTLAGESNTGLTAAAVTGLTLLCLGATALVTALHTDTSRAQHHLQRLLATTLRRLHRPAPQQLGPALTDFHQQARALLAARGVRILFATATAHLSMALVLLTCLYASGVTQAQVPWPTALAAFAFARLLSALPITPGGLGVVELSLTGFLALGLDGPAITKVTAAVLLFRAITYLLSIPLGAAAYLTWRCSQTLTPHRAGRQPHQCSAASRHDPVPTATGPAQRPPPHHLRNPA